MSIWTNLVANGGALRSYGTWNATGGTIPTVVADSSTGTYIKKGSTAASNYITLPCTDITLPTNEVGLQARWRIHHFRPAATSSLRCEIGVYGASPVTGGVDYFKISSVDLTGTGTTTSIGGWFRTYDVYNSGVRYTYPLNTQTVLNSLAVTVLDAATTLAAASSVYAMGIDVQTASLPVAPTVTTPGATVDIANPVVTWTHNDTLSYSVTFRGSGTTVGGGGTASTTRYLTVGTHAMQVGNDVTVSIGNTSYDGTFKITAVTATTIQYTGTTTLSEVSTASTGTAQIGDGAAQSGYHVKIYSAAQYGAGGFSPDTSAATWDSLATSGTASSLTPNATLVNGTTYRAYVRTAKDINGVNYWSPWNFTTTTVTVSPPTVTLSASFDSVNNRVTLTAQGAGNLLKADTATLEGSSGAWVPDNNCTITRSTTVADVGVASLRLSSNAAGNMNAYANGFPGGSEPLPVLPNTAYSVTGRSRAGSIARQAYVHITWLTSTGTIISGAGGTPVTNSTSAWTTHTYTATSPANAAYALPGVFVNSTGGAAELHYWDTIAFHPGSTPNYSNGGMAWTLAITRTVNGQVVAVRPPLTLSLSQAATIYDYEATRGVSNSYSATLIGTSLAGTGTVVSTAVVSATTPTNDGTFWLKAVTTPALNKGSVRILVNPSESREENLGVFRMDGRPDAVVVAGQTFGDDIDFSVATSGITEYESIKALLMHQGTLLLQEPFTDSTGAGLQRYIRVVDRSWSKEGTTAFPRRTFQVKSIEVGKGY